MNLEDFKNYKDFLAEKYSLAKRDNNGNPVKMRDIHWLNYGWGEITDPRTGQKQMKHHPDEVWFRYSISQEEPWKRVKLTTHDTRQDYPPTLSTTTIALNAKKVKDLQTMARKHVPEPPRRAPGPPQSATTRNRRLRGYQRYFVKFKMAQLIVNVQELVQNYIDTADDRSLAIEISDELLQLTRAVIKKHTLPGEKAFKYHLSQPARMLSRTVVHWHKIILRRMKKKTSASRPWTVTFTWNLPQEMFESLKCFMLCEENGGAVVKNTRCVAELQIIHRDKFRHLFTSLVNKYKPSLPTADVLVRKEKDGSHSTIIVEADHPAHVHYSKTLEKITFKARYGHFNRNGIPQHTLF